MTMDVLRAADLRVMPWKNGGGTTTEIAVHPIGADLDDFEWRVSMAEVKANGPFSLFLGIDRTLAVLTGQGIMLKIARRPPARLTRRSKPLSFPADIPIEADLVDGPITDFNVMTQRDVWVHSVQRLRLSAAGQVLIDSDATLVFLATGSALAFHGIHDVALARHDSLLFEGQSDDELRIQPVGPCELIVVRLMRIAEEETVEPSRPSTRLTSLELELPATPVP